MPLACTATALHCVLKSKVAQHAVFLPVNFLIHLHPLLLSLRPFSPGNSRVQMFWPGRRFICTAQFTLIPLFYRNILLSLLTDLSLLEADLLSC